MYAPLGLNTSDSTLFALFKVIQKNPKLDMYSSDTIRSVDKNHVDKTIFHFLLPSFF